MGVPEPYWADEDVTLHLGDCLDVLRAMEDGSIDAIVTDPPYGIGFMGKEWDSGKAFVERKADKRNTFDHVGGNHNPVDSADAARTRRVEGQRFGAWCEAWAAECLRVLKPGGWFLAFGGTRTWHRLTCAVEDAGFEIRDCVADLTGIDGPGMLWLYGSGFPKSLDVPKAIDKAADYRLKAEMRRAAVVAVEQAGLTLPGNSRWDWTVGEHAPGEKWWAEFLRWLPSLADVTREHIERAIVASVCKKAGWFTSRDIYDLTAPATEDAARWEGWGTALKPAWEPVVVGRKPLTGTVAQNVLTHSTGALNIDGCRLPGGKDVPASPRRAPQGPAYGELGNDPGTGSGWDRDTGRWPPNVLLGPTAAEDLDRQSGTLTSGANLTRRGSDKFRDAYGDFAGQEECTPHRGIDSGGASRFFPVFRYEAKAGAQERPRLKDGTAHPTVKPLDLMAWLVRLVTPPGGLVLDPFAGSGTTAEACIVEGFRCVLIEKDPSSAELIKTRLRKPIQPAMFGLDEAS